MRRVLLVIALFLLSVGISVHSWAAGDCDARLTSAGVEYEIRQLIPLSLDVPTPREGVQRLIDSLVPLHPDFQTLKEIEDDLLSGRLQPGLADLMLKGERVRHTRSVIEVLDKWDRVNQADRELIEGYRILLKRIQGSLALSKSIRDLANVKPNQVEDPKPPLRAEKASESRETPKSKARLERFAANELSQSARLELQKQIGVKPENLSREDVRDLSQKEFEDLLRRAVENHQENSNSDNWEPQGQTDRDVQSEIQDRMRQSLNRRNQKPEPGQQGEQGQQDGEGDQRQKGKPGQQSDQGEERDQGQQPEPGQPGEQGQQEGQDDQRQKGKPGQQSDQGEERDQGQQPEPGQPGEQGQQEGQDDQRQKGKPGQQSDQGEERDQGQQPEPGQQGEQGQQEGQDDQRQKGKPGQQSDQGEESDQGQQDQQSGVESALDKMIESLTQKAMAQDAQSEGQEEGSEHRESEGYQKVEDRDAGIDQEEKSSGSDSNVDGGSTTQKAILDGIKDILSKIDTDNLPEREDFGQKSQQKENGEELSHSELPKSDFNESKSKDKINSKIKWESKKSKRPKEKSKRSPIQLNGSQSVELMLKVLSEIWLTILDSYDQSSSLLSAINQYVTIANKWGAQYKADVLRQEAQRALDFYHQLQIENVQFNQLSDLANSFAGEMVADAGTGKFERLKFLEKILLEKQRLNVLNVAEHRLLSLIEVMFKNQKISEATDEQIVETFVDNLLGPLSRNNVTSRLSKSDGSLDVSSIAQKIKSNELSDLILLPRLEPYISILLNTQDVPSSYVKYDGAEVPINESEFDLLQADEIDQMPRFYRDGSPMQLDLLRLLSGDMLRQRYNEELEHWDPKRPKPKRVSVVLVDVSSSMNEQRKYVLRNALMNAYLDKSQRDVVVDGGEHVVYFIPFDSEAHTPIRLGSIELAQDYFDRMRSHPIQSSGSTSVTSAVVKAFNMITEEQNQGGGELEAANILLITDGVEKFNFKSILDARTQVHPDTKIKMNALTMGDFNHDVTRLIETQGGLGAGSLGEVYHQHIPYNEVSHLLDDNRLRLLERARFKGKRLKLRPKSTNELVGAVNAVANQLNRLRMDKSISVRSVSSILFDLNGESVEPVSREINAILAELPNQILSANWTVGQRADLFLKVIGHLSSLLGVPDGEIFGQLEGTLIQRLRGWL